MVYRPVLFGPIVLCLEFAGHFPGGQSICPECPKVSGGRQSVSREFPEVCILRASGDCPEVVGVSGGSKNSYSNKKTNQCVFDARRLCGSSGLSSVFVFCDSLFLIVDPEEQDAVGSKNSYSNKKTNQYVFDARRLCGSSGLSSVFVLPNRIVLIARGSCSCCFSVARVAFPPVPAGLNQIPVHRMFGSASEVRVPDEICKDERVLLHVCCSMSSISCSVSAKAGDIEDGVVGPSHGIARTRTGTKKANERSHSPEIGKVKARKKMKPGVEDAPGKKSWTEGSEKKVPWSQKEISQSQSEISKRLDSQNDQMTMIAKTIMTHQKSVWAQKTFKVSKRQLLELPVPQHTVEAVQL
eukprot:jgi/Bigna1/75059/fgenesh1_pg.32_\